MTDEAIQSHWGPETVMATVVKEGKPFEYKLSNVPVAEKLEKFMEDVKFGIYPITAFALSQPPPPKTRAVSPEAQPGAPGHNETTVTPAPLGKNETSATTGQEANQGTQGVEPEPNKPGEPRRIVQMLAALGLSDIMAEAAEEDHKLVMEGKMSEEEMANKGYYSIICTAKFDDYRNRQITALGISFNEDPDDVAQDLVDRNFISAVDKELARGAIADVYRKVAVRAAKVAAIAASLNPGEDLPDVSGLGDEDEEIQSIKRYSPEEREKIFGAGIFKKLKLYLTEDDSEGRAIAVDPLRAAKERDPTGVATKYPLPEGAFFCGPVPQEGSAPYRETEPSVNAFDFTHILEAQALEEQAAQQAAAEQQQGNSNANNLNAVAPEAAVNDVTDNLDNLQMSQSQGNTASGEITPQPHQPTPPPGAEGQQEPQEDRQQE